MPDDNKMIVRYTQEEAAYTPVSMTAGEACAGCRWFVGEQAGGPSCHIVETYPLDIEPTGYCNKYAGVENAMLEQVVHVAPVPVIIQEMAHGEPAPETTGYIAPDSNKSNLISNALDRFKHGIKPGVNVLKDAVGRRYMLIVTSNSYEDRDKETITTDALRADTERHWIADDIFKSDNPLLFWHDDNLAIGDIVFGDVRGPFLVELAREGDTPLAHKMFDYIEQHPEEKWGASHRFGYRDDDRTESGEFKRIYKKETSLLPRQHAANLLTYSGVLPTMSNAKNDYMDKMLGLEGAMDILEKEGIQALVARLSAAGIEHKSADKPETPAVNEDEKSVIATFGKLVGALIESQSDIDARIEDATKSMNESKKAYDDKVAQLDTALKATQDMQAALKEQLDARPRMATRATENTIENDQLKQEFTRPQVKIDPVFGVAVKE